MSSFNSHCQSFYSLLSSDREFSRGVLKNLFSHNRWYSTKFVGIGSHAVVLYNGFASKENVYKISLTLYGPDTEYEGLLGTWLTSHPGPFYPPQYDGFLNLVKVWRACRLDKVQTENLRDSLEKMAIHWYRNSSIETKQMSYITRLLEDCTKILKEIESDKSAAFIQELEKFPQNTQMCLLLARTEEELLFRAKSCLLQIIKTYEYLRKQFSWIHGDLRIDNILVKSIDGFEIEYPGEKKIHVLKGDGKITVFAMADLGFSHLTSKDSLKIMEFKSLEDWNPDYEHEISYNHDLHLLGLSMGLSIAHMYRKLGGRDSEGKILALLKFCTELIMPVEFLKDSKEKEIIKRIKNGAASAQIAEDVCGKLLVIEDVQITYIPRKIIKNHQIERKFSEHNIFSEYEMKRKRKREE
jgi:hypothetical protein